LIFFYRVKKNKQTKKYTFLIRNVEKLESLGFDVRNFLCPKISYISKLSSSNPIVAIKERQPKQINDIGYQIKIKINIDFYLKYNGTVSTQRVFFGRDKIR